MPKMKKHANGKLTLREHNRKTKQYFSRLHKPVQRSSSSSLGKIGDILEMKDNEWITVLVDGIVKDRSFDKDTQFLITKNAEKVEIKEIPIESSSYNMQSYYLGEQLCQETFCLTTQEKVVFLSTVPTNKVLIGFGIYKGLFRRLSRLGKTG